MMLLFKSVYTWWSFSLFIGHSFREFGLRILEFDKPAEAFGNYAQTYDYKLLDEGKQWF